LLSLSLFAPTLLLAWLVRGRQWAVVAIPAPLLLLISTAIVLGAAGAIYHVYNETRLNLRRLERTFAQVRAGEAAIEELSDIGGVFAPLVMQLQDLLRDMRRQKGEAVQAEGEIRQRIAQRTSGMERLIGSLRVQANRDALTGLYNRRMLENHLGTMIDEGRSAGSDLCLLMMDLDNFKVLNDTLGHPAGDELLRSIGQLIRSAIREQDLGFRCGGDEFVVVLQGAGPSCGKGMAERLISLVDALGRTLKTPKPIGMSAGVCAVSEWPGVDAKELLAMADEKLYQIKGRRKAKSATVAPEAA
jgi:diguanylate cyclase (GGDEF)-like protein